MYIFQVADKFRKMSLLNVYGRKRGRVGVKQCMQFLPFLKLFVRFFFDDYMSKLFPIFYLANFVCFYPSKYKAFPPNINYIFFILPYTKYIVLILTKLCRNPVYYLSVSKYISKVLCHAFEYLLCLKDLMWFLYRSLNVLAVMPL